MEATMFSGPFFREASKRKQQGRDAKILITADDGATGVGKSALAVALALSLDTSPDGFDAETKATLDVERFLGLYDELEQGSAVILDEAEQIDSRRSMSNKNIDAAFRWQTRRVNEITAILTLPSADMIDKRMEEMCDYWVNVEIRGRARIYKKKIHRTKRHVYYKGMQTLQWPNLDGHPDYEALARMKDEMISSGGGDDWIRQSEADEELERARKDTRRETRDDLIRSLVKECGISRTDVAPAVDLTPQRVGQIANRN